MPNQFDEAHQRLYNDGTESGSVGYTVEDQTVVTLPASALDVVFQWRAQVRYTGTTVGGTDTLNGQLQYRKNGGAWTTVNGASSNVRSAATASIADGANTTRRLTDYSGQTFDGTAQFDEVDGSVAGVLLRVADPGVPNLSIYTECLFSIVFRSADLAHGDTIQLRVTDAGVALTTYAYTPTFTINLKAGTQSFPMFM